MAVGVQSVGQGLSARLSIGTEIETVPQLDMQRMVVSLDGVQDAACCFSHPGMIAQSCAFMQQWTCIAADLHPFPQSMSTLLF